MLVPVVTAATTAAEVADRAEKSIFGRRVGHAAHLALAGLVAPVAEGFFGLL